MLATASTITDAKGNFSLIHLQAGEYRLKGIRNGYLQTYYGARRAGSQGIMLASKPWPGAEKPATQAAAIRRGRGNRSRSRRRTAGGSAHCADRSELPERHTALAGCGTIRRDGRSRPVPDSRRLLRAPTMCAPDRSNSKIGASRWITRPKTLRRERRSSQHSVPPRPKLPAHRKIEVAAGDRFTGADVTLLRSRLFRVRVILEAPPGIDSGIGLHPRPKLSDGLGPDPPSDCKAHVCEFSAVPNGPYWAVGSTQPRNMTIQDMFSNSVQTQVSVPVDVNDADVDGVRVVIAAPAEIAGRVTVAGGEHADIKDARVRFVDADGREHDARVSSDGSFTARLSQGRYEVEARAAAI